MINLTEENQVLQQQLVTTLREFNLSIQKPLFDILVSHCEVNSHHGVGILLQRIFSDTQNLISLRSKNLYEGVQSFGRQSVCLDLEEDSFLQVAQKVINYLNHSQPNRLLSVPYFPEDYLLTLVIKKLYDCPLCLFIMDDQNIVHPNVSDKIVQEVIDVSDLCLGISPPLCNAYEEKFKKHFWFVPPVVEDHLIVQSRIDLPLSMTENPKGILIGNIWSQKWLDKLRLLCRETGIQVDWYGNPNRSWLLFEEGDLEKDGIYFKGFLAEEDLIKCLRESYYAIIPTGSSENPEDRPELSKMSLPSRSCFMVATANLPILVVGDESSVIAQFVKDNELGAICQYEAQDFQEKINDLLQPANQQQIRNRAYQLAQKLRANGLAEWIWQSVENGRPIDLRYERMRSRNLPETLSMVITPNEVTPKHGTGVLIRRFFPDDSDIISLRSENHYQGDHYFGVRNYYLPYRGWSRLRIFGDLIQQLESIQNHQLQRLFCVAYFPADLMIAIAIKELYNIPMAIWILDDQNIAVNNIPDDLMKEFLSKAEVRFATHPELRDAYENKYGLKFWLLPAAVPNALITDKIATPKTEYCQEVRGALLGSLWSQQWFNALCESIQGANVKLDWFGNPEYSWLTDSEAELQAKGIFPQGLTPEEQLAKQLQDYPFIIVPYGTLDERDDQPQLSQLSLPGRMLFALATSNTPIILLGSPKTCAAKFIQRFKIGVICDYTPDSLAQAIADVMEPCQQQALRENAVKVARHFSDQDIDEWIWQSLAQQQAADDRFEAIMPRSPIDIVHFIEAPVPSIVYKDYAQVYQVMRRLKINQYRPDFVVDVGASHGIWSHTTAQLFPETQFILIDPLISRYEQAARNYYLNNIPNAKFLEIAVSNQAGQLSFQVSPDLYGSSLLTPADFRIYETVTVPVKTLDQIAEEEHLTGRGILKLDVQCAEHIVLEGATHFLAQLDLIVAELSFVRYDEQALIFLEMLNLLEQLGFRYYDETGEWRSPIDGTLLQKEVVFIRHELLIPETSRQI